MTRDGRAAGAQDSLETPQNDETREPRGPQVNKTDLKDDVEADGNEKEEDCYTVRAKKLVEEWERQRQARYMKRIEEDKVRDEKLAQEEQEKQVRAQALLRQREERARLWVEVKEDREMKRIQRDLSKPGWMDWE
jgi:hypothetical protein